jgi:hypothetical protein
VPEEAADAVGQLRQPAHVANDGTLKLRLAARRRLAGHRLLQVAVEPLVRVQLRAVTWEVEHLTWGVSLSSAVFYRLTKASPLSVQTAFRFEPLSVLVSSNQATSHSVGAHGSRTTIPLTAIRAQEGETILDRGFRSHVFYRFTHLDPSGRDQGPAE